MSNDPESIIGRLTLIVASRDAYIAALLAEIQQLRDQNFDLTNKWVTAVDESYMKTVRMAAAIGGNRL